MTSNTADRANSPDVVGLMQQGLDFVSDVAGQLSAPDWNAPSPCEEWTAKQVLGHLTGVIRIGADILNGKQPDFNLGVVELGADPAAEWNESAQSLQQALETVEVTEVIDSPKGPRSIADGLTFPAIDLYLHAWDIGRAGGIDVTIPDGVIADVRTILGGVPEEMLRSPGTFKPERTAPAGSSETLQLMAYLGRDVT